MKTLGEYMEHPDYSQQYGKIHKRLRQPQKCREEGPLPYLDGCVYCLEHNSGNEKYLIGCKSDYVCREHSDVEPSFPPEPVEEEPSDEEVKQNIEFPYLLLRECSLSEPLLQHKRVMILLHGLNERTFLKYMPLAYQFWHRTGVPVVLFPLSFSINRVYPGWRGEIRDILKRRKRRKGNERSHRFNATLSDRLEQHPERFFWGGIQSYWDIIDFVRQIRDPNGDKVINKHIAADARIDFFAYSSGGYLALALTALDHEGLFSESRACLYATCVEMDDLRPASPYVVDEGAERVLRRLYVDNFDELPSKHKKHLPNRRMRHWLDHHPEGRWLRSFGGRFPNRAEREERLKELAPRLLGIANTNDLVMPWRRMRDVLLGDERDTGVRFEKLDLGIHENSFAFSDYHQSEGDFILGTINWELYGDKFEQFIGWIVEHLEN